MDQSERGSNLKLVKGAGTSGPAERDVLDPAIRAMSDQQLDDELRRMTQAQIARAKSQPRRDLRFVMGPRDPEAERWADLLVERLVRNLNYNALHDVPTT